MILENLHLTSFLSKANLFDWCGYFGLIYILSLMETLKELDDMSYAYRKKARLQKYKNINSQMAFSLQKCSAQDQTGPNWVFIGWDPGSFFTTYI